MLLDVEKIVGQAEIAAMLGVSRQRVQQLVAKSGFPAPAAHLSMGKVWFTSDIRSWAGAHNRELPGDTPDRDEHV